MYSLWHYVNNVKWNEELKKIIMQLQYVSQSRRLSNCLSCLLLFSEEKKITVNQYNITIKAKQRTEASSCSYILLLLTVVVFLLFLVFQKFPRGELICFSRDGKWNGQCNDMWDEMLIEALLRLRGYASLSFFSILLQSIIFLWSKDIFFEG